jgi:hypothetical protein
MNWSRIFFGNWEAAVGFAALGWATAGLLLLSGRSSKYVMLPAYFALMQVSCSKGYVVVSSGMTSLGTWQQQREGDSIWGVTTLLGLCLMVDGGALARPLTVLLHNCILHTKF